MFYYWDGITFIVYNEIPMYEGAYSMKVIQSTLFVFVKKGYYMINATTGELIGQRIE